MTNSDTSNAGNWSKTAQLADGSLPPPVGNTPNYATRNPDYTLNGSDKVGNATDNIYIDLDAIIDTRLGTIAQMDSALATSVLNSGKYHKRLVDEFVGVDKERFREAYAARDIMTLRHSVLTNVVFFMRRLVKDSLLSAVMHARVEKMTFTVNVWPYQFDDPGLVEMLIACIRFHTYSTSSVQIVSISPQELTPLHCRDNYQIMVRYDWVKWADEHKAFFEKQGIPGVTVVVPELFYDTAPNDDDIQRLNMRKQNPFVQTEAIVAPLFRLKHMPSSMFSIHENLNKKDAAEQIARVEVTQADIEDFLTKNHPKATLVQEDPLPVVNIDDAFVLL